MTALLPVVAALVTGLFIGGVLVSSYAAVAMSHSQERMEKKVRYWQAQTARAGEVTMQLTRLLATREGWRESTARQEWR
jgi:hypothetical protein